MDGSFIEELSPLLAELCIKVDSLHCYFKQSSLFHHLRVQLKDAAFDKRFKIKW